MGSTARYLNEFSEKEVFFFHEADLNSMKIEKEVIKWKDIFW